MMWTGRAPMGRDQNRFTAAVEAPQEIAMSKANDCWGIEVGSNAIKAVRLTMKGDEIIEKGDIVVTDNHIAAVGSKGKVTVPAGAKVI